jgi:NO-binding membrane sensor protein with MHYT domain
VEGQVGLGLAGLVPSHDLRLVAAALAVALMAGFTGLSLTRGAQGLAPGPRKAVVSMAAVALGGGIWSMHFVAMLGLQLPILFYYDALVTLVSALAAILMTGAALLILHFRPRSRANLTLAGAILGAGIPVMHYIGMSGMELCRPVAGPAAVAAASAVSIALGIVVVRIAYGDRGRRSILLGTLVFGTAVVAVHFLALAGTDFVATGETRIAGPLIGNAVLAFLVTLSGFAISGAFLLTGVTFVPVPAAAADPVKPQAPRAEPPVPPADAAGRTAALPVRVPYEREGRIHFADSAAVAALRADGHYTTLHLGAERHFCPWSISEAEARLAAAGFLRVHRSFLVNPRHVSGFSRDKDQGWCSFEGAPGLGRVPVSRSRLPDLRAVLGL